MKRVCPNLILLVGPSACGKSLFSQHFRRAFPEYEGVDDRYLVEEYLIQNDLLKIEDPVVWDEIAVRLVEDLNPRKRYLVEFARGHDMAYLKRFKITPTDVYPKTIDLMLRCMHRSLAKTAAVIHITCDFRYRASRNIERRKTTGQNLPDSVLESVFREDIFLPDYIDAGRETIRRGFINKSIPVVTIDNTRHIPDDRHSEHFKSLSIRAMKLLAEMN